MKEIYQKYKQLLPLIILLGICIYNYCDSLPVSDNNGLTYSRSLTINHVAAFIAVVFDLIIFFTYRPFYKYLLFITLIFGVFEIINFVPNQATLNFGSLHIPFHITPIFVGVFTMAINYKRFRENPTDDAGQSFEKIPSPTVLSDLEEDIEKFKLKYKDQSTETLTNILTEKKYTASAMEAAKQLLEEREQQQKSPDISIGT